MNHDERVRAVALDTAEAKLNDTGRVSLAEVAAAADVSMPEIREQFPRASHLLVGLLDRWLERVDDAVDAELDTAEPEAGQLTRAFVLAHLSEDEQLRTPWRRASVVAAALERPEVIQRLTAWFARWESELADDRVHPQRLRLVLLALEGLGVTELLTGDAASGADDRARAREPLLALLAHPSAPLDPAVP